MRLTAGGCLSYPHLDIIRGGKQRASVLFRLKCLHKPPSSNQTAFFLLPVSAISELRVSQLLLTSVSRLLLHVVSTVVSSFSLASFSCCLLRVPDHFWSTESPCHRSGHVCPYKHARVSAHLTLDPMATTYIHTHKTAKLLNI